jgi:hypothetical protein
MKVHRYTAPSAWASYLINGDASGLEDSDIAQADEWLDWVGMGSPVDCVDVGFCWRHDAFNVCPLGADCQEYVFLDHEVTV